MNPRDIDAASAHVLERRGLLLGEQPDDPSDCAHCGEPDCSCQRLDDDLGELEASCYVCVDESEGFIDPQCHKCAGTGRIDAPDHPSWCSACGMSGRCPDCDGDAYDRANDR